MQQTITVNDLWRAIREDRSAQLIDVRSPFEFASGHIPGAVNVPMEELESRLDDVAKQAVLVCQGGKRASICCDWIGDQRGTAVLEGGTDAWRRSGYSLVRSVRSRWSLERQVRLGAGLLVLAATLLAATFAHPALYLAMFVGAGLTFAGLTNICGMALVLARMPWNRVTKTGSKGTSPVADCCS